VALNSESVDPFVSCNTSLVINRITVCNPGAGNYPVPALGVTIQVVGAESAAILHTLTYSPRAVALAAGPAPAVPASWRWIVPGTQRVGGMHRRRPA
jgi:hypothetical protein